MHVLYVHPNFPAQFGHVANAMAALPGWRATFVNQVTSGTVARVQCIQYKTVGGATSQNHFCTRTFENAVWQCDAVYQALKARPEIRPDLIVGHAGFGTTLFLPELYPNVPIINFGEYYYRPNDPDSDMTFRKDLPWPLNDAQLQRARCRNAMILLDLQNCATAYTPTQFQLSRFPSEYHHKMPVIFDGIDRSVYHGYNQTLRPPISKRTTRTICGVEVPSTTRIVTYVSRGFESIRGFDIFLRASKLISQQFSDVVFIVVGSDRICYGGDDTYTEGKTFKQWALEREQPDLSKIVFAGKIPPTELARLLASTDLHIYLTSPFVLSWSMMDAMSCGAVVLGSDTPPVKEMIHDGKNGLLADFFDAEGIARRAVEVLKDPDAFRATGNSAEQMIAERYSLETVLPKMRALYTRVTGSAQGRTPTPSFGNVFAG